ncbi:MAG: hypothetical protein KKB30_10595, partial [Proteobacteria bacterium]|nr:hypothetical protein [Pseudomonadota bacterium]MBU1717084.1 hypothetical protein [Pseudomonadota bacterium]
SGPYLAVKPLPFASSYGHIPNIQETTMTVIFLQRTFTSLVYAHVGRTQTGRADRENGAVLNSVSTGRGSSPKALSL